MLVSCWAFLAGSVVIGRAGVNREWRTGLREVASGHSHHVAAGILPAVGSGILPPGPALKAVLKSGHDFERHLPMSEYALVSRTLLRRRFGFDVVVAERDSQLYRTYVEFFSRVREAPDARKGVLRLRL